MHAYRRKLLLRGLELFDLGVVAFAFVAAALAYAQRTSLGFGEVLSLRLTVANFLLMIGFLSSCRLVFRANRLYESRRFSTASAEAGDILKSISFITLMLAAAAVTFKVEVVLSRSFLFTFWTTSAGTLIACRIVLRKTLTLMRVNGRTLRHVLIVGTNRRAIHIARTLETTPELGYSLVGFADDTWAGIRPFYASGYRMVADLRDVSAFLRESVVDEVFVCLPLKSYYEHVRDLVERCESQGIIVRLLGQLFDLQIAQARVETFADENVVSLYACRMDGAPFLSKRVFDVVASITLLVLTAPILLLAAMAIKMTSPGPIVFTQQRIGVNKRQFKMFKFRTMVVDAEQRQAALESLNEVSGPVFKIKNDPRITPVGRFLRKTSIDELPQLVNVLKGDMSLVGPRPLPIRDFNGFDREWHRRRFSIRPGITCLWQVTGRSDISFEQWMELDMQYIDQWSLWLDVKILVKTVPAVLRGAGAA